MTSSEPGGSDLDRAEQQAPTYPAEQPETAAETAVPTEADPADVQDQVAVVELDEDESGR